LTQPGWEDAADYFRVRDKKYGTSKLKVLAVVQLETADRNAVPAPTTFGELMESLEIVPGISQLPQGTSRPGSSHNRLGLVNPQLRTRISGHQPAAKGDMSPVLRAKSIEPVSFYPCM